MDKTLYLLRHAKSSWEDPTLADHDRPLAARGRRASKAIAEYLRTHRSTPRLVLCSSSERTRETFKRISAGLRGGVEVIEARLYTASASGLLRRLHEVDARVDSVMLIGHYRARTWAKARVRRHAAERKLADHPTSHRMFTRRDLRGVVGDGTG